MPLHGWGTPIDAHRAAAAFAAGPHTVRSGCFHGVPADLANACLYQTIGDVSAPASFAPTLAPIPKPRTGRLHHLLLLLFLGAFGAFGQPLLSHMEEGDQIRLRLWVSACFQVEDNIYQFEMKAGKILCTGFILPDYVLPHSHPRVPVGPVELSRAQVQGIDLDIVRFRQTERHSRHVNNNQVLVIKRANEARSETMSEASLTFIEKGKTIIEESIVCPNLHPDPEAPHQGLAELKQLLQQRSEAQMNQTKLSVSRDAHRPASDTPAANDASGSVTEAASLP